MKKDSCQSGNSCSVEPSPCAGELRNKFRKNHLVH